jgi:hypothetical protein
MITDPRRETIADRRMVRKDAMSLRNVYGRREGTGLEARMGYVKP